MVLASKLGERVISLSLLRAPHKGDGVGSAPNLIRELGLTGWAARSQRSRLGADNSAEQVERWTYGPRCTSDPRPCIGPSTYSPFLTDLIVQQRALTTPTTRISTDEQRLHRVNNPH